MACNIRIWSGQFELSLQGTPEFVEDGILSLSLTLRESLREIDLLLVLGLGVLRLFDYYGEGGS